MLQGPQSLPGALRNTVGSATLVAKRCSGLSATPPGLQDPVDTFFPASSDSQERQASVCVHGECKSTLQSSQAVDEMLLSPPPSRKPSKNARRPSKKSAQAVDDTLPSPGNKNSFESYLQLPLALSRLGSDGSENERSDHRCWSVVLLQRVFVERRSAADAMMQLATVLSIDAVEAEQLLEKARTEASVPLASFTTRKEAMLIAQQLRDVGMAVRVTSDTTITPSRDCLTQLQEPRTGTYRTRRLSAGDVTCKVSQSKQARRFSSQTSTSNDQSCKQDAFWEVEKSASSDTEGVSIRTSTQDVLAPAAEQHRKHDAFSGEATSLAKRGDRACYDSEGASRNPSKPSVAPLGSTPRTSMRAVEQLQKQDAFSSETASLTPRGDKASNESETVALRKSSKQSVASMGGQSCQLNTPRASMRVEDLESETVALRRSSKQSVASMGVQSCQLNTPRASMRVAELESETVALRKSSKQSVASMGDKSCQLNTARASMRVAELVRKQDAFLADATSSTERDDKACHESEGALRKSSKHSVAPMESTPKTSMRGVEQFWKKEAFAGETTSLKTRGNRPLYESEGITSRKSSKQSVAPLESMPGTSTRAAEHHWKQDAFLGDAVSSTKRGEASHESEGALRKSSKQSMDQTCELNTASLFMRATDQLWKQDDRAGEAIPLTKSAGRASCESETTASRKSSKHSVTPMGDKFAWMRAVDELRNQSASSGGATSSTNRGDKDSSESEAPYSRKSSKRSVPPMEDTTSHDETPSAPMRASTWDLIELEGEGATHSETASYDIKAPTLGSALKAFSEKERDKLLDPQREPTSTPTRPTVEKKGSASVKTDRTWKALINKHKGNLLNPQKEATSTRIEPPVEKNGSVSDGPRWKSLIDKHRNKILEHGEEKHTEARKGSSKLASKDGNPLKQACRLVRTFVFGDITNEPLQLSRLSPGEKELVLSKVMRETIGSKSMVRVLHTVFVELDKGKNHFVTIEDFHAYVEAKQRWSVAEVSELEALFFKKDARRLSVKDLMSLIWPNAGPMELRTMMDWFENSDETRVKAPPVLPAQEWAGLCRVFSDIAGCTSNKVSFHTLVIEDCIYRDQREELEHLWCQDGSGRIGLEEFCNMLCPAGFRVHENSTIGKLDDGRIVYLDSSINQWYVEPNGIDVSKVAGG